MGYNPFVFIPARKGSKRLPKKNRLSLSFRDGEEFSLFELALRRAVLSEFKTIVVSTDDENIRSDDTRDYLSLLGPVCNVLLLPRPEELAGDDVRVWKVAFWAWKELERMDLGTFDSMIMTLPTSPFVTSHDLRLAWQIFLDNNGRTVMSVTKTNFNPYTLAFKQPEGTEDPHPNRLWPSKFNGVWKDIKPCKPHYLSNGGVYVTRMDKFVDAMDVKYYRGDGVYHDGMISYELDELRGWDVNTRFQYDVATCLAAKCDLPS